MFHNRCWDWTKRTLIVMSSFVIIQYTTVPVYQRSNMYRSLLTAHFSTAFGRVFQHLVFITTRGRSEWLIICSGLFGCLPLWTSRMKQLPRQQKLIAMITEALPSGATQREIRMHPAAPTHSLSMPRKRFPCLNTSNDLMVKLRNLPETWKCST